MHQLLPSYSVACEEYFGDVIMLIDSTSLPQKLKSRMGNPDWNVSMVDIHLQKL